MGYYTETTDSSIFLHKNHFEDVYKKMCELNDYHDLKRGGSYGGNNDNVEGDRYPRDKWFSWMPYNYPEIYSDMHSILEAVGFEVTYDKDGNLVNLYYGNKTGSEDYFLTCFAGFVRNESFILWKGEESDDYYRYLFENGKMIVQHAQVQITYPDEYTITYEFGKPSPSDIQMNDWLKARQDDKAKEKALADTSID